MKTFRGKHGKVTESMKKEMKKLRDSGMTYTQIAHMFNVCVATVSYHLSPGRKEKIKQHLKDRRKKHGVDSNRDPEKRREWNRIYLRERYNNDPEFRERMKGHVKKSSSKRRVLERESKKEAI